MIMRVKKELILRGVGMKVEKEELMAGKVAGKKYIR